MERTQSRDLTVGRIANSLLDDLVRLVGNDCRFRPRVWIGTDHARLYTGARDEHLKVYRDGRIVSSRSRMTWGVHIDAAIEAMRKESA